MKTKEGAKKFVEKLKPETTSEAKSYFRAYWKKNCTCRCHRQKGFETSRVCGKMIELQKKFQ